MEPTQIEIVRGFEIALRARELDNPGPANLQLKRLCESLNMAPAAFEIAATLSGQEPDEYFEVQSQIGMILDAVASPVRLRVATLNTRTMSKEEHLASVRAQGAHAAASGKLIEACPYADAERRTEWRHSFRRLRREMRKYSRIWVNKMRVSRKAREP